MIYFPHRSERNSNEWFPLNFISFTYNFWAPDPGQGAHRWLIVMVKGISGMSSNHLKTSFWHKDNCIAQNLIKPVVYDGFEVTFVKRTGKVMEKHYVYHVSVTSLPLADKPYKTLVTSIVRNSKITIPKSL